MGQYHRAACLDTREFIDCHQLGDGLKLAEQIGGVGGVASALVALLAVSNGRGGGDLPDESAEKVAGRWGGKRVVIIGDYAEDSDYVVAPGDPKPSELYHLCAPGTYPDDRPTGAFRDITPSVADYLAEACGCVYVGDGWRDRFNLWEHVKGLTSTWAGDEEHGRVAQIDGVEYWEREVVAALGQITGDERQALPVPVETLKKHGLKPKGQ
jgi:hypothetical protein